MNKPTVTVGNISVLIILFLLVLLPLSVCALENSASPATTEFFPAPVIIPSTTGANQNLDPEKNSGLTNFSNNSINASHQNGLVNGTEQVFLPISELVKDIKKTG